MHKKPLVGISQCLLGDAVRYDGKSKPNTIVLEKLNRLFDFVPMCPEVEAGLNIPRPPVQLTGSLSSPRLTGRDDASIDITELMLAYCEQKIPTLKNLDGFIFKSRSPSCGLRSTPVFIDNREVTNKGQGVFANNVCRVYINLPVIEDNDLDDEVCYQEFLTAVQAHSTKQRD
jgi:uncharacterized protein YbbK (DUF523 family)